MTPTLNHILRTKSKETIYDINRLGKNKVNHKSQYSTESGK